MWFILSREVNEGKVGYNCGSYLGVRVYKGLYRVSDG